MLYILKKQYKTDEILEIVLFNYFIYLLFYFFERVGLLEKNKLDNIKYFKKIVSYERFSLIS